MARGRARATGVAAGVRFCQAVRADDPAAGHRDEVALLLGLGAGQMQRTATQARVGRDDEPQRAPDAPDLLDGDGVGQRVETRPTFVLRDRDPKPAEFADALDDLRREAPRPFVCIDDRRYLGHHEVPDRLAQEHVFRGEVQVHDSERTTQTAHLGSRC